MLILDINKRIFFNKYKVHKLIYKSSLCLVYEGKNIKSNESVAMKFERKKGKFNTLETEAYNLFNLKGYGIPKLVTFGKSGIFNILIEELLGPSIYNLWNLKKIKDIRLLLKNICMLSIQGLERLEYIHSKNIIHSDIKPENFLIGKTDPHIIYLIDFGISHKYRSSRTGKHIKFQNRNKIFGSIRYMSINANKGYELSRRDDLEAFGYMLVYLANNNLPWIYFEKLKISKINYLKEVLKLKSSISLNELCKGLPEEFVEFIKYCRNLKFEEQPNYNYLKGLFTSFLSRNFEKLDYLFFWIKILKRDNIEKIRNNFLKRSNSTKKRLYNNIKKSLDKAKSQEQNVKFNFHLNLKNINKKNISKDHKINNYYINGKNSFEINNYNIKKINTQYNNHKLTDINEFNSKDIINKYIENSKNSIVYNNNNSVNFFKEKNNNNNIIFIKKININNRKIDLSNINNINDINKINKNYNINNQLSTNDRINLTYNYLSKNEKINLKNNNKLIHLSYINKLNSNENKKDTIYKTFNEREKLKKINLQKSLDNNFKSNRINENKYIIKKKY